MDMDYLTLEHKKFLVEHYVYDAWQFTTCIPEIYNEGGTTPNFS